MDNDMSMVRFWLNALSQSYGRPREPMAQHVLTEHYCSEEWQEIFCLVLQQFGLRYTVPVTLVRTREGDTRPACLVWKRDIHWALTAHTRRNVIMLQINVAFLQRAPYHAIIAMFAHESAHVLLESTQHPFAGYEKFVDLTAVHFGFSEHMLYGARYYASEGNERHEYGCGYLSTRERDYATRHVLPQPA